MKKIIIALSLLVAFSCNDYLEEENLSNVSAEEFYATADGYKSLLNANYAQLKQIYGQEPWLFVAGTDLYTRGRSTEPIGLTEYTQLNPSSEGVDQLYTTCYKAIQLANMALYYSEITENTSSLNNQIGEIKFLRANAYFLLVQTYGGVSLVTDYINSPQSSFERNTEEEIYTFIISELEESLELVKSGSFDGHANKRAVQHELALVYLTRGYQSYGSNQDFVTAASYADLAISGQGLTNSFESTVNPNNQMNNEILFSVQYSSGAVSSSPSTLGNRQSNYFSSYQGGSEVAGSAPYRAYQLCPTQFAISLFDEGDERWEGSFMTEVYKRYYDYYDVADHSSLVVAEYYEPKWHANDTAYKANYMANHPEAEYHEYGTYGVTVTPTSDYEIIPLKKFDDPSAPFGNSTSTRDVVVSRLSDTYLIAAEAYLKSGNAALALQRLNEVRSRANVTLATISQLDIDYILDERARELFGDYNRWFDLKRTGKLVERASLHNFAIQQSNFIGNGGVLKILRPIPQAAIDLNQSTNFQQNPGY